MIHAGLALLTWMQDSFGFSDSFDESESRYRGLRGGQLVTLADADTPGLLVKSEVVHKQLEAERDPSLLSVGRRTGRLKSSETRPRPGRTLA